MDHDRSLEAFLTRSGLSEETWARSGCDWSSLIAIGNDHATHSKHLQESAELFTRVIQRLHRVHSVRWRVKDVEHLMAKIVRKKAEDNEKYREVSLENYHHLVTDLIGIRALHLFKDECIEIDDQLRALWKPVETPVVYIREGDQGELTKRFAAEGFEVKSHPAGYRSVHYVFESRPLNRSVFVELQVRTIFEEAWSEIDHRVRYPNFSQTELVAYFLAIFNRLSGSADEMGGFVRGLASTLKELESRAIRAGIEKKEALDGMEKTLGEMEAVRKRDKESSEQINRLKTEIDRLKRSSLVSTSVAAGPSDAGAPSALEKPRRTPAHAADIENLLKPHALAAELDRFGKFLTPSIDMEKLAKLTAPSIDFDKLARLTVPSIDMEKFARASADALEKLTTPSADTEKLVRASFNALERLATPSADTEKLVRASFNALERLATPSADIEKLARASSNALERLATPSVDLDALTKIQRSTSALDKLAALNATASATAGKESGASSHPPSQSDTDKS